MNTQSYPQAILVLGTLLFLGSCKDEPPTASFTTSSEVGVLSKEMTFTTNAQHSNSFYWEFGDGSFSNDKNPVHAFIKIENYTVKLTASGDGGSVAYSKVIKITKPTIANFALTDSVFEPNEVVYFENTSENGRSYYWQFGDTSTSKLAKPSHAFGETRVFDVRLKVLHTKCEKESADLVSAHQYIHYK